MTAPVDHCPALCAANVQLPGSRHQKAVKRCWSTACIPADLYRRHSNRIGEDGCCTFRLVPVAL